MLVLEYFFGAILQIIGCFGGLYFFQRLSRKQNLTQKDSLYLFCLFTIFEASLFAILSFIHLLSPVFLSIWFWSKATLGLLYCFYYKSQIIEFIKHYTLFFFACITLFFAISVPTANFDCFSAHFAIPRLFLQHGGYPLRPDYQYLDALPLAGHMWYLPGMAAGFEGALNVISAIYTILIIITLKIFYGKKCAFYGTLLLFSMPQWTRITLDPMMDTPSCFYSLYSTILCINILKKRTIPAGPFFLISCFIVSLKPTLIAFPVIAMIVIIVHFKQFHLKKKEFVYLFAALLCGGIWYFKNAFLYGNPFYPHLFSNSIAPNIPEQYQSIKPTLSSSLLNYFLVVIADHRWVLSFGPWPLIGIPFLVFNFRYKKIRYIMLYLGLGFIITWAFTSFKNRYFIPYLVCILPFASIWMSRAPIWAKGFLKANVVFTLLLFLPYFLQPAYVLLKSLDYKSYNTFKYPKYSVFHQVNQSEAKKVLLVGQPAYWLKKDHLLAVISETHLDFTKLDSMQQLTHFLKENQIDTIVYDRDDAIGMSAKKDPHYRKKSYQAQVCRDWMNQLLQSKEIEIIINDKGIIVAKTTFGKSA